MTVKNLIKKFGSKTTDLLVEEQGASLVEYVMLVALIGVMSIVSMRFLGVTASSKLHNAGTTIS